MINFTYLISQSYSAVIKLSQQSAHRCPAEINVHFTIAGALSAVVSLTIIILFSGDIKST